MTDALRKAIQLVLALHDRGMALGEHPDPLTLQHGWVVRLDPQAEEQLRRALEEDLIEVTKSWDFGDYESTAMVTLDELGHLIKHGEQGIENGMSTSEVTSLTIWTETTDAYKARMQAEAERG